jgi:uncharacterized membrane protein
MQDSTPGTSSQDENGGNAELNGVDRLDSPSSPSSGLSLCPNCAAQMPETSAFCPACGRSVEPPLRTQGSVGIFRENMAGALAYFTFIPAILFLVLEPYKRNRFVRFHSGQCLLLWAGAALAAVAIRLAAVFLYAIPVAGPLFVVLVAVVAALFVTVTWLVLLVKALQGEMFKLPLLGDIAEKHASAI